MPEQPNILTDAQAITSTERPRAYGHPAENHGCTAELWTQYLIRRGWSVNDDGVLSPRDVCMLNVLQKVSRDANAPKRDNLVDIAGYARNAEMIDEWAGGPVSPPPPA